MFLFPANFTFAFCSEIPEGKENDPPPIEIEQDFEPLDAMELLVAKKKSGRTSGGVPSTRVLRSVSLQKKKGPADDDV